MASLFDSGSDLTNISETLTWVLKKVKYSTIMPDIVGVRG